MAERLMTYAEMEVTLRRTPEAVRQLVKRKRWRRIVGNDRKARIAVPLDFIESSVPDDTPPSVPDDAETTPSSLPVAVPDAGQEPTRPTGDARALLDMLEARVAELDADLRQARTKIEALTVDAGRVTALEVLLENERQRVEEWKAVADRWALQAERLSEQRRVWWPFRRRA